MPAYDKKGREIPVHRLRANESVWSPPSVIFLDTETRWRRRAGCEVHTLRLWAACHVDRREVRKGSGPVTWGWGDTPAELAAWIGERMVGRECVWLYAHNLGFDLTTSRLTETLAGRGWTVSDFSVGHGEPWLRLAKGRKTLTCVDSFSWLPTSLEKVAGALGRRKLKLPAKTAGAPKWLARCATDVELTARAMLSLMDWWDTERLGRWSISGASCAYNAMRHMPSHDRHVIDPEPELVALDRLACRGGRKDAAVYTDVPAGRFVELDLADAYPTAARDLPLPVRRAETFTSLPVGSKWIGSLVAGPIARVTITTDRPRYPVRHNGVTWYPVGTFSTVLAGPEIRWARDNGDLVAVHEGQMHELGAALRPWATWVLDPSRGGTVEVPAVVPIFAKAAGRRVLGKFAAHSHASERLEGPTPPGWDITQMWDGRVDRKAALLHIGGQAWWVTYDGDTENCYPAVYAWVESEIRVRLGKVLDALDGAWWVADTDGAVLDVDALAAWLRSKGLAPRGGPNYAQRCSEALCDALGPLVAPLTLRPKRTFTGMRVIGPQHTVSGGVRKLSGVSAEATEVAPDTFAGYDWPGLKWQIERSTPGEYRRPLRRSTFTAPTVHRWVLADGTTVPVEFRLDPQGANELVAFTETERYAGAELAAGKQYRLLERVAS